MYQEDIAYQILQPSAWLLRNAKFNEGKKTLNDFKYILQNVYENELHAENQRGNCDTSVSTNKKNWYDRRV